MSLHTRIEVRLTSSYSSRPDGPGYTYIEQKSVPGTGTGADSSLNIHVSISLRWRIASDDSEAAPVGAPVPDVATPEEADEATDPLAVRRLLPGWTPGDGLPGEEEDRSVEADEEPIRRDLIWNSIRSMIVLSYVYGCHKQCHILLPFVLGYTPPLNLSSA